MKKKILILTLLMLAVAFTLAITSYCATIYKETADGEVLFSGTFSNNQVVEYNATKRFPKLDENGNALTWYVTGVTETDAEGNTVKYVAKDLTKNVFNASTGNYNEGKTFALKVVSANFDNDGTVTKFDSYLFGHHDSAKYSKELLFVYVPDSVTTIGERMCQYVPSVLEIYFSENSKCKTIGKFFALQAYSLRTVYMPPLLEELVYDENLGQFYNCSRLTNVNFYPNSKLKIIGGKAFGNTGLRSLTLPNSVTTICSKAFQGSRKLTYINFGAGFNCFKAVMDDYFSLVYEVGDGVSGENLTIVIPGNIITYDYGNMNSEKLFSYMFPRTVNIQYAGTAEQYSEFVKLITESTYVNSSGANTLFNNNHGLKGCNVTYVSACTAFYNGVHGEEVETVKYENGFALGGERFVGCGRCNEGETTALSPIISALGFSLNSFSTDRLRIASGYNVEVELVELYEKVTLSKLEIGVVFASKAALDGLIIANGGALPQTLNGITHFSDHMEKTYSQYSFKIEFPSPENDPSHYASYSLLPFAISAFINETHTYDPGHIYTYYQTDGMVSDGTVVDGVVSGAFEYTTINAIYQNIKK